jgi:Raf kinase inhibitor-like YbhB/YbcL family protein
MARRLLLLIAMHPSRPGQSEGPFPGTEPLNVAGPRSYDEPYGSFEILGPEEALARRREERRAQAAESVRAARAGKLTLSSPEFSDGGFIPREYTADGEDVSPQLTWREAPRDTQSFALLCEDLDAPSGPFVHWLAWDIPASAREVRRGVQPSADNYAIRQGENDFQQTGYRGPRPSPGAPHRYAFRLYALDARPELEVGAQREAFAAALDGHILATATLTGLYPR